MQPYKTAIIAVVIATVSSVGISVVSEIGTQTIKTEMDAMGMKGYAASLHSILGENKTDSYYYNNILSIKEIEYASPIITENATAILSNGMEINAMAWGISEHFNDIISMQVLGGRFIGDKDIESNALVCLIDETIAKKIYKRSSVYGKKIILSMGDKSAVFSIIGTVKKNSNILK